MIWQVARVIRSDERTLVVRLSAPEHCQRCAAGRGCGAGVFSRLFSRGDTRLELPPRAGHQVGEAVRLGVTPIALARASLLHYGLALAGFLAGAWLGQRWAPAGVVGDAAALISGLAGLALAIGPVGRRLPRRLNPVVERLSCSNSDAKFNSISS